MRRRRKNPLKLLLWAFVPVVIGVVPFMIIDYVLTFPLTGEAQEEETTEGLSLAANLEEVFAQKVALEAPTIPETITIGWAGDIAPDDIATTETFSGVSWYTQRPDIMTGNLEGVITDGTLTETRCDPETETACWIFEGPTEFGEILSTVGFDVLSLANNHARDYGSEGLSQTVALLENQTTVTHASLEFVEKKDIIVGFVSAYLHGLRDFSKIQEAVVESEKNADLTVVMFHGGAEGSEYRHVTGEDEFYKGYYRGNMQAFAYDMIDHGADLVLGSGPHVLRGVEHYKGRIIAYSMGNFYGDQFATGGLLASSGIFKITLDTDANIHSMQLLPLRLSPDGVPSVDRSRASIDFVNNVSKTDFGEKAVLFDEYGFWRK